MVFFGCTDGFFVGTVEVFGVVPGVFDGVKKVDLFFQVFLERDAARVVGMCGDDQTFRVVFAVLAQVLKIVNFLGFHCGVNDEDVFAVDAFFDSGDQ